VGSHKRHRIRFNSSHRHHLRASATLHDRERRRHPRPARRSHRHRRLQPAQDPQRDQLRHVGGDRARHRGAREGRVGAWHRLPRRRDRGLRLGRGHLRVPGAAQGRRVVAALRRGHRGRLRGDPRVPEADGRDDLRLLHGRGDGHRDGLRPAFRRRGQQVRHPRRQAEHRLSARGDRPARGSRRPRVREGHPVLRPHRGRPRGPRHRPHPAPGAGGRAGAHDLRLSAAGQRERAALGARQQAVDPVLPRRLHRGATHTVARAVARGGRERGYKEGTRAFLEKRPPKFQGR